MHALASLGGEHRYATIGFLELEGTDATLAAVGPERLAARLEDLVRATQQISRRYGIQFLYTDVIADGLKLISTAGAPTTTANDEESTRLKGLREGADDYVSKGASMEELAVRVETVLRRTRETDRVRRMFAQYTSDAVVEEILRTGEVVLSGEKREVTVLFADLRNFTSFAESHAPEEVMRQLNQVLGRLADVVLEHGGTLDKFLGDGLMAVWGAPVRHADDAVQAVRAALQMIREVAEVNTTRVGEAPFELGVGLNTGMVLAGSIGSARRTEYTCIGDAVNVASRLCALAAPGWVLLGETTASAVGDAITVETLEPVRVKGKAHPVPLFRVAPT